MNLEELSQLGLRTRKEVMGAQHVEARIAAAGQFMAPLQDLINRWAYGEIWPRQNLARDTRSLIVIAMMAALNRPQELRVHLKGAINNGCTIDEIQEVLLQVAAYCGLPASLDAHHVAQEVLTELGVLNERKPGVNGKDATGHD